MSLTSFKTINNLAGWAVFAVAAIILGLAAEPTGSLWDCGEFIAGAYKLQVVHPPGAPVFLLVGRLFAWMATLFSDDPANIAYAVNLLSAISTAAAAMFVCWSTTILARLTIAGRDDSETLSAAQRAAVIGSGVVAGLATAFCTSIWFSAVEGEVYAMSTFFTCLTLWAVLKWYYLPDTADTDRWLVFAMYASALSIGVHLLSLLTFPALAMFYYFKKARRPNITGTLTAAGIGVAFILGIQYFVIAGIPRFWSWFDIQMVNTVGAPFYSGIIPVFLLFGGAIWYGLRKARQTNNGLLQRIVVSLGVVVIAYMCYGMVIIRAAANPPINMNDPSDPVRLLPYLNREQYGERPLLRGAHFDAQPIDVTSEPRYGRVGDRYAVVDEKIDYVYAPNDKTLFPRMGDGTQGRPAIYRQWIDKKSGVPTFGDQIEFFWKYQLGWMYWRYFMWNFAGRQNGEQGYYAWDKSAGNWMSGIPFIDNYRLGDQSQLPEHLKNNQARNKYFMIPFFLGLLGLFFQYQRRSRDFAALLALFIITGIGIIVYSNQPPNEPRERDYVLAGSFFVYCIWIGLSVIALFDMISRRIGDSIAAGAGATLIGLVAPLLMVTQNWDDHSRAKHYGSRDYAKNFLESCQPNAIIFTYGDNDTYPLWYCQEVEGIRTDIRVVNLSLIAVDWYINLLRRKVNQSDPIEMTVPEAQVKGYKRMQIPVYSTDGNVNKEMDIRAVMKFLAEDHKLPSQSGRDFDTYLPTTKITIPVNKEEIYENNVVARGDSSATVVDTILMDLGRASYIGKDQLAIIDIIASNIWKRPIYWAVTTREDRLMGLNDYLQLEGLALRLVPVKTPSTELLGIIGCGRVGTDIAYKNIMEKWAWGNFDKERLFVDRSYAPSLQTMKVAMIRLGQELAAEGKNDKAIALTDKFFEAFPTMNFPNDQLTVYFANVYAAAGAKDKAADIIRSVAKSAAEQLEFHKSLDPLDLRGYQQDNQMAMATVQSLLSIAQSLKDEALMKELEDMFATLMPGSLRIPGAGQLPQ